jgi:hypothetical protein
MINKMLKLLRLFVAIPLSINKATITNCADGYQSVINSHFSSEGEKEGSRLQAR